MADTYEEHSELVTIRSCHNGDCDRVEHDLYGPRGNCHNYLSFDSNPLVIDIAGEMEMQVGNTFSNEPDSPVKSPEDQDYQQHDVDDFVSNQDENSSFTVVQTEMEVDCNINEEDNTININFEDVEDRDNSDDNENNVDSEEVQNFTNVSQSHDHNNMSKGSKNRRIN